MTADADWDTAGRQSRNHNQQLQLSQAHRPSIIPGAIGEDAILTTHTYNTRYQLGIQNPVIRSSAVRAMDY
ncbi:uncharacterized [Tachysurus ichikawai]